MRAMVQMMMVIAVAVIAKYGRRHEFGFFSSGRIDPEEFYGLKVRTLVNQQVSLEQARDKVVLITNVASQCGYTKSNYEQLATLKREFGDQLLVVLIPSNDFDQETGSPNEIQKFVADHGGSDYLVLAKSSLNGPEANPFVEWLKRMSKSQDRRIEWNFETKFIVSKDGITVARFSDAFDAIKLKPTLRFYLNQDHTKEL